MTVSRRLRTALICHHDAPLHQEGLSRWLADWSDLTGVVIIEEPAALLWKRVRREARRVGWLRLADVLAFRLWYRLRMAAPDARYRERRLAALRVRFPRLPAVAVVRVSSPNAVASEHFLRAARPDVVLALCKNILAERVFTIPEHGTYVLHPGICPEYRNAHGCFWALATGDLERVGMTMLRIDRGIDAGPIFGYFRASYDDLRDSHVAIQDAMVIENLDGIAERLRDIVAGRAGPIDTTGRRSREWGQPWLTAYRRWKRRARRRHDARRHA